MTLIYGIAIRLIAVKTDPSLGGSYEGNEPHGLIWGLKPLPDVADKYPRFVKYDVTTPFVFSIDLLDQGLAGGKRWESACLDYDGEMVSGGLRGEDTHENGSSRRGVVYTQEKRWVPGLCEKVTYVKRSV